MSGKDASGTAAQSRMKARFSWAGGVLAVGALCFATYRYAGPAAAHAQAPVVKPGNKPTFSGSKQSPAGGAKQGTSSGVRQAGATAPLKSDARSSRAAAAPAANSEVESEVKVVAVVNGEQITRQDLARECLARYGKDIIQNIVNKHLILQACQKRGVVITEKHVEDEISRIANKFGLSPDRWLVLLEQERNISPGEYRREIIWPTLALRTLASDQMGVTADELREALESEHGPKVKARLIAVEERKKAEQILAKAQANPDDFENLAKDHSIDPSASVMGLIPPIRKHLGDANFERVAFSLKKGEISPIITVGNQHIILKCEDQIKETYLTGKQLEKVQEHLTDRIRDQKMRSAASELFAKLQKEGKVENIFNDPAKQKQKPGVAALINGQPITIRQLSEECIVRHGPTVLDGEINRLLLTQELKKKNRVVEEKDLNEEVARAADTYGFIKSDGSPDIDKWLKKITEQDGATVELYLKDAVWPSAALKKLIGGNVTVNEEDLKKGFDANYGERVEVLAIVCGNQRQAQQVWEMARDNPTDRDFGDLAQQYSIEPASKANFGKVPPIRRHSGQPAVEEQAFKMKPGQLSSIISVGDKFIILRCLGRTTPQVSKMDDTVRDELRKDIVEKKLRIAMNKEFDRLKEQSQVDNFLTNTSESGHRSKGSVSNAPPSEVRAGSVSKRPAGPAGPPSGDSATRPSTLPKR